MSDDEYDDDFVDTKGDTAVSGAISHQGSLNPTFIAPLSPPAQPDAQVEPSTNDSKSRLDTRKHRYSISVDLRSIKEMKGNFNIFLRYTYPTFGRSTPVQTNPATQVSSNTEQLLPNAFNEFEFILSERKLSDAFYTEPLLIEVHHKDHTGNRELGIAKIDLMKLLSAPERPRRQEPGTMRVLDKYTNVYTMSGENTGNARVVKVGSIRTVLTLEDYGLTFDDDVNGTNNANAFGDNSVPPDSVGYNANQGLPMGSYAVPHGQQNMQLGGNPQQHPQQMNSAMGMSMGSMGGPQPGMMMGQPGMMPPQMDQAAIQARQGLEYQVAWELEMWKRMQQAQFADDLKSKEAERLAELEAEFKKQDVLREQMMNAKTKQMAKLEKKLKTALFEVEAQEKRLRMGEQELVTEHKKLAREYESYKEEALNTVKRVRTQAKQQTESNKKLVIDHRKEVDMLKIELEEANIRFKKLDEEFRQFKAKSAKSTAGQLRQQLALKDNEIKQMHQAVETAQQMENRAKTQLMQCLREIGRLRKEKEQEQQERLQLERMDIQRLRMQFLAKQQQQGLRRDTFELDAIKRDLRRLMSDDGQVPRAPANVVGVDQLAQSGPKVPLSSSSSSNVLSNLPPPPVSQTYTFPPAPSLSNSGNKENTPQQQQPEWVASTQREIQRLNQERDQLLQTGSYTQENPIINELNTRIGHLQEKIKLVHG